MGHHHRHDCGPLAADITITAPLDGEVVSGETVRVEATITGDLSKVDHVVLFAGTTVLSTVDEGGGVYSAVWNANIETPGNAPVIAQAQSIANVTLDSDTITVDIAVPG